MPPIEGAGLCAGDVYKRQVQKNVGPAGMAVVIIREDLLREDLSKFVPTYLSYKTHADNDSLYNTPNCWAIYCCGKVFKYLLATGGLEAMNRRNEEKAAVLYDFLDQSKFFTGAVVKENRSLMNVPFVSPSKEQDAEVVAASKEAGFDLSLIHILHSRLPSSARQTVWA